MDAQTARIFDKQATILKAIADPMRFRILNAISERQEASVSELIKALGIEQSHLSHNLIKMKDKGVLQSRKDGKYIIYRLDDSIKFAMSGSAFTLSFTHKANA